MRLLERADQCEDCGTPLAAGLFHLARNQAIDTRRRTRRAVPLDRDRLEIDRGASETVLDLRWE